MKRMKSAIFIITTFALFSNVFGCATTPQSRFEPMDIPTLGELVAGEDTIPTEPSLKTALRLIVGTKYANGVEACVVSSSSTSEGAAVNRDKSHADAANILAKVFTDGNLEMLGARPTRMNWWLSSNSKTCYTQLCVVPPATLQAERAFALLPGQRTPTISPEVEKKAVTEPAAPATVAIIPPKGIWELAALQKNGDSFTFEDHLCSVGQADFAKPRQLNEAKENSSFLAASNLLYILRKQLNHDVFDNDTEVLLAAAAVKEWRQPKARTVEAAVCVNIPQDEVASAP